jgi:hypothetical protein
VPQRHAPSDHLEGVLGTGARSMQARPVPVWAWLSGWVLRDIDTSLRKKDQEEDQEIVV